MWFGIHIGPFIVGGSARRSGNDAGDDDLPAWTTLERGAWRLLLVLVAAITVGAIVMVVTAWVRQHGAAEAVRTAAWIVVGVPAATVFLHALGRFGDDR